MRTAAGSNWTHCAHTGDSGPGTRRYWRVITSKRKQRQRKNNKSNENKLKMRALDMRTNIAPEFAGVLIGIRVPLFLDYGRDDRYYGGGDETDRACYPITLYGPSWTRTTKYRKGHGGRELSHTGRARLFFEARSQRWRQGVEEEDPVGLWIMLFCAFALRLFCFFRLECLAFHGGFASY